MEATEHAERQHRAAVTNDDDRFGEMQERYVTKKVSLEDNSNTNTVLQREQVDCQPQLVCPCGSAKRLGVDIHEPSEIENAFEDQAAEGYDYGATLVRRSATHLNGLARGPLD